MKEKQLEEKLLELLEDYYHYKYMTSVFHKMSMYDFMRWLRSKQ